MLSAESQRQTPLGAALRRAEKSRCAPAEETILAVMRRWFFARRTDSGFRLAGFPRTVRQALVLDEWLETRGESLDGCLSLTGAAIPESATTAYYRERGLLLEVDEPTANALSPR